MAKSKFYAVRKGRLTGIYLTWKETEEQVKGFSGAEYKSFSSREEADGYLSPKGERDTILVPQDNGLIFYTDGSCKNGEAGWAYILVSPQGNILVEKNGLLPLDIRQKGITNNRGELYAILSVLKDYPREDLSIYTDSMLSINILTKWASNWEKRGWKKSNGETPVNLDLIQRIIRLQEGRAITYNHVYGHTGNYYNEYVDKLAGAY